MRRRELALIVVIVSSYAPIVSAQVKETRRLDACRDVLVEALGVKEGIPGELLDGAECVAVIPGVKKAALGFGGRFGYGALACRVGERRARWGAPLMVSLKGGSFGLQIGGQEADIVLLLMNPRAVDSLLRSKVTLGGDASLAIGPVGRSAEAATDARMRAEILSYSRARGLFAGLSLEGAVLKADEGANRRLYGERFGPRQILLDPEQPVPKAADGLLRALGRESPGASR